VRDSTAHPAVSIRSEDEDSVFQMYVHKIHRSLDTSGLRSDSEAPHTSFSVTGPTRGGLKGVSEVLGSMDETAVLSSRARLPLGGGARIQRQLSRKGIMIPRDRVSQAIDSNLGSRSELQIAYRH
jgi:hypothetical protein